MDPGDASNGGHCASKLPPGCRRWLPPHPSPLWGPAGGCASIAPVSHSMANVFIFVLIWGQFSQEPGAAEIKAGLGRRGEVEGLRGGLRPTRLQRGSNPPAWEAQELCPGPRRHLPGESKASPVCTPGVHGGGHGCCRPDSGAGGGLGEGGEGQPRPPALSRASRDTAQPLSLPEHPQERGWGWCCVRCWGQGVPLPRALPSCHLGDPQRAVAPRAALPECRCLGLGSTGAAESIAPLRVPVRALCLSPPDCHRELPSTLASPREHGSVGPLGRAITRRWQAVTQSLLCQDTPSLQPAPPGVPGTRGCTGTAVPGTIFPCWPVSPVATQEQELRFSSPGTTPVQGRAVPRARLAQERVSCGSALHRCHPKASPVPVPIPGG